LQQLGVFTQEAEPHPKAGPKPGTGFCVRLNGAPAGDHRRGPEQNRQRIDGHENRAQRQQRCGADDQHQKKSGAAVDVSREKAQQQHAQNSADYRREKAHAELSVAPEVRAEPLRICNQRWLAVIRKREVLGPDPLIGFIFAQFDQAAFEIEKIREKREGDENVAEAEPVSVE
jgi:hypothetical protein